MCQVAYFDEKYPYILPFSFGAHEDKDRVVLYFHGAIDGKKYDVMEKNPEVGFEMGMENEISMTKKKEIVPPPMKVW